jgi:hypothetical protein
MGAAAVPILIATTVASGVYSAQQQKAAGKAASAEAQIAANREGDAARGREIERRRALLRAIASQNAAAGAGGVSVNEATLGADLMYATDDLMTDRSNTLQTQSLLRLQGSNAKRAGNAGAFTTLLDTAGSTAALMYTPKKPKK